MSYDRWKLHTPMDDGPDECPDCGSMDVEEDRRERSAECLECGWSDGFDWDAEAERRAEAREIATDARYEEWGL